ncbi:MAG: hypothetical protein EAZ99_06700 [Alphaproteobacteria bacterium]|nr:hypothetical protein [Alphaproteobacteria bacterium]TAD90309.1 MAG: hypothetical protein EAZ99_06700 [Alphaproteobacteria bacterium]
MDAWQLTVAPLVPSWLVVAVAVASLIGVIATAWLRAKGVLWRALALATLCLALANPSLVEETRAYRPDIAVVVVDDTSSQTIGSRAQQTEAALARLQAAAREAGDLELRVVRVSDDAANLVDDGGSRLFQALDRAMADLPRRRFAGAVMITDGQVHDVPGRTEGLPGPIHAMITGQRGEVDRRLVVVRAPSFGLVDRSVTVTIRVEDDRTRDPVAVSVRQDGGEVRQIRVVPGQNTDIEVMIRKGGVTLVELEAAGGPRELTPINNRAVVSINGIRDRLRVLLVSGEPHAGERTWRNLLKADPSVELVHFTILRPPEKQDSTPIHELSLIAFPVRELFEVKLHEFDLIIFDRYRRMSILPRVYISAVADYVRRGGAVLEAAGPAFSGPNSLFRSPLSEVLPAEPTGRIYERGFRPAVTDTGRRHPVTAGLDGAGGGSTEPSWGRWFRHIEVQARSGETVMAGVDGTPLLVLDRVGEGRIAQLASDHIWLWTRGFEGGGPQAELLRRLAHWLMKEPQLEEEDLTATLRGPRLEIVRRSLKPDPVTVTITDPVGEQRRLALDDRGNGRSEGTVTPTRPGLYTITDGTLRTLAAVGSLNPREWSDVRATEQALRPIAAATGGGILWLEAGAVDLRRVREERAASGRDWIGFVQRRDFDVTGVKQFPLLPVWGALALALGGLMLAWRREGR